jgi:hypothetical protein
MSALKKLSTLSITLSIGVALFFGLTMPAMAQPTDGERLRTHGDWQSFTVGSTGTRMCVALSFPQKVEPEGLNRGDIAILVSHQLEFRDFDVVQLKVGYPLETGRNVKIDIDGEIWELFPHGENAWPLNIEQNGEILKAMKSGLEMYVEARSQRGNTTMDRYSLRGISAAMRQIDNACGR